MLKKFLLLLHVVLVTSLFFGSINVASSSAFWVFLHIISMKKRIYFQSLYFRSHKISLCYFVNVVSSSRFMKLYLELYPIRNDSISIILYMFFLNRSSGLLEVMILLVGVKGVIDNNKINNFYKEKLIQQYYCSLTQGGPW